MATEFEPNRAEVLRYLGYRDAEADEQTKSLMEDVTKELKAISTPKLVSRTTGIEHLPDGISCRDCKLMLPGKDLKRHLSGCTKAILLAVTLGVDIEKRLRVYEATDLVRAMMMDACASAMVEAVCEDFTKQEAEKYKDSYLTQRFSPGYGDLPLEIQPNFLRVLDTARKIGLTCNDSCLMLPRKSVSAIIGISPAPVSVRTRCETCRMQKNCQFRKRGEMCENNG